MRYHYANAENQAVGPIEESELHDLFKSGTIANETNIIAESADEWKSYGSLLARLTPHIASPMPPTQAAAPSPSQPSGLKKLAIAFYIWAITDLALSMFGINTTFFLGSLSSFSPYILGVTGFTLMQIHKKNSFRFALESGEEIIWKSVNMVSATCLTKDRIYCHWLDKKSKQTILKKSSNQAFFPTEDNVIILRSDIVNIGKGKSNLRGIIVLEMKDGSKSTPIVFGKNMEILRTKLSKG